MTQYNSLNVNLLNSQLNKLESAIKNKTEIVLRLSSNMISDDETNFLHKLLLTNRQVSNLRKAFFDKSSTDIKLSKNQISKLIQSRGFLGRLLCPLLKTGLPLIKKVIKSLVKIVLIPLRLTAAASAAATGIHNKLFGSGRTTLIISNDQVKDIEKVKSLEDSCLLLEGVSQAIQNEAKEKRGGFLSMLLGTLGADLLGNILAGKGINRAGEGIVRVVVKDKIIKTKRIFNAVSSFN